MREGRLVQYADPATLLNSPKDEFVRDFVGADRMLKGLRLIKVKDVMQKPPLTVKVGEDPMQVKARMESENLRWSMLTEDGGHFLGWIACDDLETAKPIREVIIPPTITAAPATPLNEALSMMLNSAIGTLAILDEYERLIGVLSFQIIRDVLGEQAPNDQLQFCKEDE